MRNIKGLLVLLAPYRALIIMATLLGALTVGSNIGLLAISAVLISRAALHPPILDLMTLIVGVRFFGISRAIFRYFERYLTHDITLRILAQVRVWFYSKLEPLAPARLMDYRSGDLFSRIVGDVETLKFFYLRVLAAPLVAFLVLLGIFVFLAWFYLPAALMVLIFFLLAGVGVPLMVRVSSQGLGRESLELKAKLNIALVDSIQGMTDILAFNRKRHHELLIEDLSKELIKIQSKIAGFNGISTAVTGLFSHLTMWSVLVLTIPLVANGKLDGIYLAMLALGAMASFEAVLPLPMACQQLEESLAAANRLQKITDVNPVITQSGVISSKPPKYELQAANLSFAYTKKSPYSLQNLNFFLPEGGKIAVVGPSGAGKSTLVNLLLRFWEYKEGSITLGGCELKKYSPEYVRSQIGVMTQRTYLFNTTIRENLLVAKPNASEEEIIESCKKARIHQFIQSLAQGYDSYIGEGGFKLSGGERKRLGIARILLKNSPILILDEATVGLDAVTEKEVMNSIYELMVGRTTLVITHRLTGLEKMDDILVLKQGKIVEQGKHETLLAKQGFYYKMWKLQREVCL